MNRPALLALLAVTVAPSVAHANGLELPENGAESMGRAGAYTARADDPTAIMQNVAGLGGTQGVEVTLGANAGSLSNCFTHAGTYPSSSTTNVFSSGTRFDGSSYDRGNVPYPTVCNRPGISVTPHLLASVRINRYVAVGLGLYAPNSTGASEVYDDALMTSAGLAPSPARYLIYEKSLLLAHLALAVAFVPAPWIRFGVALEPTYAAFHLGTMANIVPADAQSPDTDARMEIDTSGFFLGGSIGVQVLPSRYFEFGASLHGTADALLHGDATVISGYYAAAAGDRTTSQFHVDRMTVPLPWTARFGARFMLPRAGALAPGAWSRDRRRAYDPMRDEVFDVEADFVYEATHTLGDIVLQNSGSIHAGAVVAPAPAEVDVRSNFHDSLGVRLGGDANVVPGVLAVRAGVAYSTGAQDASLAEIHLPSYDTLSLHAGVSVRLGPVTLTAAYGHFFMGSLDASAGQRTVLSTGQVTPALCAGSAGADACATNRGTYAAHFDMASLGITTRF